MNDRMQLLLYLILALWAASLYCFRYGVIGYFFAVALALSRHCFLNAGNGWSSFFVLELFLLLGFYMIVFSPAIMLSQLYDTYRILKWRRRVLAENERAVPGATP